MPPLPSSKEVLGPAQNFHEDRDPIAEESDSESDDNRTLAAILKGKKNIADPLSDYPSPSLDLPEGHPTRSRTVVRK